VPNPRGLIAAVLCLTATVFIYGCGSGSGASRPAGAHVPIKERDFRISAPRTLSPGRVALSVDNAGPDDHELIVVRAPGSLPRRTDGLTLDEDAFEKQTVGVLEPGLGQRELDVTLRPGRYVMFCNMQGHYLGGMHHAFRVG
jgi:uncharacterized cupredoxin-like copper-binding protein